MKLDIETKRRSNHENGATAVEFAVIVLLLLVITFGILEFAFIFYQRHFIGNAAREGVRIGIRADNYDCFASGCSGTLSRHDMVNGEVRNYLSALYESGDITDIIITPNALTPGMPDSDKTLTVLVRVKNFFPQLLSGLIPGYKQPTTLSSSANGIYEDPEEYDREINE